MKSTLKLLTGVFIKVVDGFVLARRRCTYILFGISRRAQRRTVQRWTVSVYDGPSESWPWPVRICNERACGGVAFDTSLCCAAELAAFLKQATGSGVACGGCGKDMFFNAEQGRFRAVCTGGGVDIRSHPPGSGGEVSAVFLPMDSARVVADRIWWSLLRRRDAPSDRHWAVGYVNTCDGWVVRAIEPARGLLFDIDMYHASVLASFLEHPEMGREFSFTAAHDEWSVVRTDGLAVLHRMGPRRAAAILSDDSARLLAASLRQALEVAASADRMRIMVAVNESAAAASWAGK